MDFKHMFHRKKASGGSEGQRKRDISSTAGAHELFLEYEGFLPSSYSRPSKSSTPTVQRRQPQGLRAVTVRKEATSEKASRDSTSSCNKSVLTVTNKCDSVKESSLRRKSLPSRRKRDLFLLNRLPRSDEKTTATQKVRSSPVDTPERDNIARNCSSCWLPRCLSTTSRIRRPSPPPSFTSVPPHYGDTVIDDGGLTALPALPGYGKAPPCPSGNILGGSAARVAANAHNDVPVAMQSLRLAEPKLTRDSESGVGIEVRDRGDSTDLETPIVRKGNRSNYG